MRHNRRRTTITAALAITALTLLTGCGDKYAEPFKDAPRSGTNTSAAQIVTMPDGFSNAATKCDHGNRIYSAYHGDNKYAAITVVPGDPTCK